MLSKLKCFSKNTFVALSLSTSTVILSGIAVFLPINKAEAGTQYPVLDQEWECIGCGGNCAEYECSCQ